MKGEPVASCSCQREAGPVPVLAFSVLLAIPSGISAPWGRGLVLQGQCCACTPEDRAQHTVGPHEMPVKPRCSKRSSEAASNSAPRPEVREGAHSGPC